MTTMEIAAAALAAVEKSKLDYVVVGALASNYYAFSRATKDADFVVAASLNCIDEIAPFFPPTFLVDPQPQMEMMTGTSRWIVEVEDTEFRVEIFHLGGDAHHAEIFRRRIQVTMPWYSTKVWTLTAEDLVIQKVRWGRAKDMVDVANILSVQRDALDFAYIEGWCATHGTTARYAAARAALPSRASNT
jgi:hypothetical protein